MASRNPGPPPTNRAKRTMQLSTLFIALLIGASISGAAVSSQRIEDNPRSSFNPEIHFNFESKADDETESTKALHPKLTPIPAKENVNPQKADEIPPSSELKEIIARVKNKTMPQYANNTATKIDYSIREEDLAIIRSGGKTVEAGEVQPSPALKAVLEAYRNGSLDYTQRDIKEVEEEIFYHQPYVEMNTSTIYDIVVLRTGRDIFLSLNYQPLSKNEKTPKELTSRKIKDLQQTITAIKVKEKQKKGEETDERGERHTNPQVKIQIKPKVTFARRMLNFLGIRRRDTTVDYEKLSKTYRAYRLWSKHVQDVDDMLRRKRRRKIRLIQQHRYRPSKRIDCNDPSFRGICPDGQLKIDPYKKGNIRFLKP